MITKENLKNVMKMIPEKTLKRFLKSTKEFFFISCNSYGYITDAICTDDNNGTFLKLATEKNYNSNNVLLNNDYEIEQLLIEILKEKQEA